MILYDNGQIVFGLVFMSIPKGFTCNNKYALENQSYVWSWLFLTTSSSFKLFHFSLKNEIYYFVFTLQHYLAWLN